MVTDLIQEVQEIARKLNMEDMGVALQVAVVIQQNRIAQEGRANTSTLISNLVDMVDEMFTKPNLSHQTEGTGTENDVKVYK